MQSSCLRACHLPLLGAWRTHHAGGASARAGSRHRPALGWGKAGGNKPLALPLPVFASMFRTYTTYHLTIPSASFSPRHCHRYMPYRHISTIPLSATLEISTCYTRLCASAPRCLLPASAHTVVRAFLFCLVLVLCAAERSGVIQRYYAFSNRRTSALCLPLTAPGPYYCLYKRTNAA